MGENELDVGQKTTGFCVGWLGIYQPPPATEFLRLLEDEISNAVTKSPSRRKGWETVISHQ